MFKINDMKTLQITSDSDRLKQALQTLMYALSLPENSEQQIGRLKEIYAMHPFLGNTYFSVKYRKYFWNQTLQRWETGINRLTIKQACTNYLYCKLQFPHLKIKLVYSDLTRIS
jgi:hypothetical protein